MVVEPEVKADGFRSRVRVSGPGNGTDREVLGSYHTREYCCCDGPPAPRLALHTTPAATYTLGARPRSCRNVMAVESDDHVAACPDCHSEQGAPWIESTRN